MKHPLLHIAGILRRKHKKIDYLSRSRDYPSVSVHLVITTILSVRTRELYDGYARSWQARYRRIYAFPSWKRRSWLASGIYGECATAAPVTSAAFLTLVSHVTIVSQALVRVPSLSPFFSPSPPIALCIWIRMG